MPSRITEKLNALRAQNKKAFVAYIMVGDPDIATTENVIYALADAGADIIELGVPFSDPMADGKVIQDAHERALKNEIHLHDIFNLVQRVRLKSQIPILLMGYLNPVLQFGYNNFASAAAKAGIDAVLLVDLPVAEASEFKSYLTPKNIDLIFLLTPTSTKERIAAVKKIASGFVYYVSLTGVTGAKSLSVSPTLKKNVAEIKKQIALPVLIGFGISTPAHVRALAPLADGVVVGSVLVNAMAKSTPRTAAYNLTAVVKNLVSVL